MTGGGGVLVTRMTDEKASALALQSQGQLIVERDQNLQLLDVNYLQSELVSYNLPTTGSALTAEFLVIAQDKPIEGAEVYLFGSLLPAHGITDANGKVQEVRGDGVVGEQPHLAPGQGFRYSSGAVLETPVGSTHGSYQMVADDGAQFDAPIPAFRLAIPGVLH